MLRVPLEITCPTKYAGSLSLSQTLSPEEVKCDDLAITKETPLMHTTL